VKRLLLILCLPILMGPVEFKRGKDAGSITCILATTKNAAGEVVWRTDFPNNVSVAKEKNLDCGVSQSALEPDALILR